MNKFVNLLAGAAIAAFSLQPVAAQDGEFDNSLSFAGPDVGLPLDWQWPESMYRIPTPALKEVEPNTVQTSVLSAEAKMMAMQSMMMMNPFSLRDMMNFMVAKKKADPSLTFDDVITSMDLRANLLNMMKVGHNTPWKVLEGMTGEAQPRLEFVSYCDVQTMRDILDYVPEFSAFVPCRIAVLEDSAGDIWIMTLDWDVRWMDTAPNPNKISPELREAAILVRENIESIMEAGALGDL